MLIWMFKGEQGLRSGWRCTLHGLGLVAVSVLCAVLLIIAALVLESIGLEKGVESVPFLLMSYVIVVAFWVLWTGLSGRLLDGQGATAAGIGGPLMVSLRQLLEGALIGFLLLIPALFIMALGSRFDVVLSGFNLWGILNFLMLSTLLVFAAAAEELVFRGYGFVWLCRSVSNGLESVFGWFDWTAPNAQEVAKHLGRAGPVLGVAVLFGLVHMGNTGHTILATVNTTIAAIWLSVALFRSGALWMPIGLHWGWNWGQGLVFGLPVSGNGGDSDFLVLSSPMTVTFEGPEWLAGGLYGVEGSIGCTVALLLGCVIAAVGPSRAPSVQMAALRYPQLLVSRD